MSKKIQIFVLLFLFISTPAIFSQYTFQLQMFPALTQIDLGSLIIQNGSQGAPKLFHVTILPAGKQVKIQGVVKWDRMDGSGLKQLFAFTTGVFTSRSFYSDELGSGNFSLASTSADASLAADLVSKGKPSGYFEVTLRLYDDKDVFLAECSDRTGTFSNPAQTISVMNPTLNSTQAIGSIIARWNLIEGALGYKVKLNVRTSDSQTLEDALNSGTPLIDNREIAGAANTNVDLRTLLSREWLPGQELVLQVSAVIGGIGGNTELRSQIVNFQIARPNEEPVDNVKTALVNLLLSLQNSYATQMSLELANVSMDNVRFYNNEGSEITFAQFQTIVIAVVNLITNIRIITQ